MDETELLGIDRECIRRERNGVLNWKQKYNSYSTTRRDHMNRMKRARPALDPLKLPPQNRTQTAYGGAEGPPSYRNTARRRLDEATPRQLDVGRQTRVGYSDVADQISHHHATNLHSGARQLHSREVGSRHLWPKRVLKTQNVMEWRNFFNTTQSNNRVVGNYMTTSKADLGDHDGRKAQRQFYLPHGKVLRNTQPNPELGIYKPGKRCYDDAIRPEKFQKHALAKISLQDAIRSSQSDPM